jgi:hypothetical protein
MPTRKSTVVSVLEDPKPKKSVTRYDANDDNAALSNAYISNDALKKLGNPAKVKVTIEAA